MENFGDNLERLLGLHGLSARRASELLDVSAQTLSEWKYNKSSPSLPMILRLAEFFEVHADRLVNASFSELLATELGDPERFERVEHKIRAHRQTLRALESGKVVDVQSGKVRRSTPKKRPSSQS